MENETPQTNAKKSRKSIALIAVLAVLFFVVVAYFAERSFDYFADGESYEKPLMGEIKRSFIAAGFAHSLALSSEGKVFGAGFNRDGQLGLGDSGEETNRETFALIASPQDKNIAAVAAGWVHSFALDENGAVYGSGWNKFGQLGLGDRDDRNSFTPVSSLGDNKIVAIAAGGAHSLALDIDGKVYAAGNNEFGQLGLGDKTNRKTFALIALLKDKKIVAIAAGRAHSLALTSDGKVYAAGNNERDQLGLGDKNNRDIFMLVPDLNDKKIVAIAAGGDLSLALDADGKVYATGSNDFGQLGLGDDVNRSTFTPVSSLSDKKIVAITAGFVHALALDAGGKVYAAGWNAYGQLGLGDDADRQIFTPVSSLEGKNIIAIVAGDVHSLALGKDGKLYATGSGEHGRLGLGGENNRDIFTPVVLPDQ
ncbi:MAG: hypothetical protein LBO72_08325 [Helicobacteraceae bacterium]|nr:hypothetical protein [Helicobacteraceae bacterium]